MNTRKINKEHSKKKDRREQLKQNKTEENNQSGKHWTLRFMESRDKGERGKIPFYLRDDLQQKNKLPSTWIDIFQMRHEAPLHMV